MPSDLRPPALPALMTEVSSRSATLLDRARVDFAVRIPAAEIRFDLRGRAAGQVRLGPRRRWQVRYNPALLASHPDAFMTQTIPHECAHLIAFALYGPGIRPHGEEWRGVMRYLGAEPRRCHDFPVEALATRRLRRFPYHCACRTHELTTTRHHRAIAGQGYYCAACRGTLSPGPLPSARPGYP